MLTSCPKCNHDVSMKSLLKQQPIICDHCNAKLRVTPRSSFLLSVVSFIIGTLVYSMLHDAGPIHWLPYLYGFSATALCIILLRPIILRLHELEPDKSGLQLKKGNRQKS